MSPITHVPIPPGSPSLSLILTMIPFAHVPLPMCHIVHVPHWPCAPSPMCPISQGAPSLSSVLTMIPISSQVPIAHMSKKMSSCQKDVKLSKRCQVVKKMSNVKKSNTLTMEEVHKKNKLT